MKTDEALDLAVKLESHCSRLRCKAVSASTVASVMAGRPDYEKVSRDEREAARCAMEQIARLGLAVLTGTEGGWNSGTRLRFA